MERGRELERYGGMNEGKNGGVEGGVREVWRDG